MKNNSDRQAWARERMVEKDISPRGVKEQRVLDAMLKVPRHLFVGETQRMNAYEDHPLPIGEGQTISQPYIVALMTEALKLTGSETVLEIGTGSGYQTAMLAELSARVYSVERIPSLTGQARKVLDSLGKPLAAKKSKVVDPTYGFDIDSSDLTDHYYDARVEKFEWERAKRLKEDHGFMGKMSFPEALDRPGPH